jgi:hypothetical protein
VRWPETTKRRADITTVADAKVIKRIATFVMDEPKHEYRADTGNPFSPSALFFSWGVVVVQLAGGWVACAGSKLTCKGTRI